GDTIATQDVLPFVKTVGSRPAKTYGVNTIGLERKGFSKETIGALNRAYRILVRSKLKLEEALLRIEEELHLYPEARYLVEFVRESKRGVIR
ncbi:MAG TPA: acyl-[acyl-carrier-protein]--UDP-N-acetylglucosamine O-acyltransferase, partial [Thermoanaerobaculia bacterium]|nr:acyl-[acyl-carrier-protein]--UDP-N-acetylglucosamine O-acyltransferase [Thermoanaerobaculia bacterium]